MVPNYRGIPEGRVASIDALRGFDMFWIVGGSEVLHAICAMYDIPLTRMIAGQLRHPEFLGFTAFDLIFPLFLFVVGASIPFSMAKRRNRGDSHRDIISHVAKRALILYFFGMVMEAGRVDALGGLRYTGVLHRIALCYFFASVIVINTRVRSQAIWAGALVIVYWILMSCIPVPGHGPGVFTPEGNLSGYIDRKLLPGILYRGVYDNEGILSTIPAVATTLLGVLSGHWLRAPFSQRKKTAGLCAGGAVCLVIGLLWSTVFPINKLMWTSSYVCFTGGLSILLLALFYWLIDVKGLRGWAFPFVVIGMNALTLYVAQNLFDFGRIVTLFSYEFINHLGAFRQLFWPVSVLAVKWLFVYVLFTKRIFLKV